MNGPDKKNSQPLKVYVRQRPFNKNELDSKTPSIIQKIASREITIKSGFIEKKYTFDHIFDERATQMEIYDKIVSPLINYVTSGYNCTVFAYGQTGTGKTYTMMGDIPENADLNCFFDSTVGIIPRVSRDLFHELNKLDPRIGYTVRASFIEIFNEEVHDLLGENVTLRIYNDPDNKGTVNLKGLTEATVCSSKEVACMFHIGHSERQKAATNLNARSSRSHLIFTLSVFTREITAEGEELIKAGKFHLVDLAGSENIEKSGATDSRAREAGNINRSLLTLGKVVKGLAQKVQYISYRDSKLTRILQDSLGGNTRTAMIATVSPAATSWDETVNTLDFGNVAKGVLNCPRVNISRNHSYFIKDLENEIKKLKNELSAVRRGTGFYVTAETYQDMTESARDKEEKIVELIERIRELEEYRDSLKFEYENLKDSFEQTQVFVDATKEELRKQEEELRRKEEVLKEKLTRDEEIVITAKNLLDVCKISTKYEEIYHSKYEKQSGATLSNANVAREMAGAISGCLREIGNVYVEEKNKEDCCLKEIKDDAGSFERCNLKELEKMAEFISEMRSKGDNYEDLTTENLLKSDKVDYGGDNIRDYFDSLYRSKESNLEYHTIIKNSLQFLKSRTSSNTAEIVSKVVECLELLNGGIMQKEEYCSAAKDSLLKILAILNNQIKQVEGQMERCEIMQVQIEEYLKQREEEFKGRFDECENLKVVMEKFMESSKKYQEESLTEIIKQKLEDIHQCQQESEKMQISTLEKIEGDVQAINEDLEKKAAVEKTKVNEYVSGLIETVNTNLNHCSDVVKTAASNWMNKFTTLKNNLFNNSTNHCEVINQNVNLLSDVNSECGSNVKKLIEETSEKLEEVKENIIFSTHVGDTPVKRVYTLPKRIQELNSNL